MPKSSRDIGDPLDNVARTGKIGRSQTPKNPNTQNAEFLKAQNGESSDIQPSESPNIQKSNTPDIQNVEVLEIQTSGPLNAYTSEIVKGQKVNNLAVQTSKGTHRGRTQQTIYLPPALAKKLRIAAVEEEREISEIVTDALEDYFKNKERGSN